MCTHGGVVLFSETQSDSFPCLSYIHFLCLCTYGAVVSASDQSHVFTSVTESHVTCRGGCILKPSCQQRFKAGRVGLISKQEGSNNERRRFLMCKQSDQRWQQPLLMFNSLDGKDIGQPALSDKLILLKKETFSDSLHSFHASDTLAQTCMLCWGIFSDFSHAALWQTWTD